MKGNLLFLSLIILQQGTILNNNAGISSPIVQIQLPVTQSVRFEPLKETGISRISTKGISLLINNSTIRCFSNSYVMPMQVLSYIGRSPLNHTVKLYSAILSRKISERANITHTSYNGWVCYSVFPAGQVLNPAFRNSPVFSDHLCY